MRALLSLTFVLAAGAAAACRGSGSPEEVATPPASLARDESIIATTPGAQGVVLSSSFAAGAGAPAPAPNAPPDSTVSCPPSCGGDARPVNAFVVGRALGEKAEYVVNVAADTRVYGRASDGLTPIPYAAEHVRPGVRVSVWFEGGVQYSYPMRGTASVIVLQAP